MNDHSDDDDDEEEEEEDGNVVTYAQSPSMIH